MPYQLLTQYDSPNYTTPAQCPYVGDGGPRTIDSFTYHHWNNPGLGDTWQSTVNTLCASGVQKSAHAVATAGLVATIISAENAAWSCGNWAGNRSTYAIECDPAETDADYATVAEFTADMWRAIGRVVEPYYPHRYWTPTSCPGTYDVDRIHAMALDFYHGTTQPPGDEYDMATLDDLAAVITRPDVLQAIAGAVLAGHLPSYDGSSQPLSAVITGMRTDVHNTPDRILAAPLTSWDDAQHPLRDVLTGQRREVHQTALQTAPAPAPAPLPPAPVTPPAVPAPAAAAEPSPELLPAP